MSASGHADSSAEAHDNVPPLRARSPRKNKGGRVNDAAGAASSKQADKRSRKSGVGALPDIKGCTQRKGAASPKAKNRPDHGHRSGEEAGDEPAVQPPLGDTMSTSLFVSPDALYCQLLTAAKSDDRTLIRNLLCEPELRAMVDRRLEMTTPDGYTESFSPLDVAARAGNLGAVSSLVRYGKARVEPPPPSARGRRRGNRGKSPLYYACLYVTCTGPPKATVWQS